MKLLKQFFTGVVILVGLGALVQMPFTTAKNEASVAGMNFTAALELANIDPVLFKWGIFAGCILLIFMIVTKVGNFVS